MQNQTYLLTLVKNLIIKILNSKLVILLEYQNIKNIFAKGNTPNWSENVFVHKKVKDTASQAYVINDINGAEIFRKSY